MLAEVLIFVPSVARFREDYLLSGLERAQIASLSVEAGDMLDETLERELLETAGVMNVVLQRDNARVLVLSTPITQSISDTYDLRNASPFTLIRDALKTLVTPDMQMIRVIGEPVREAGPLIEVVMEAKPLRDAIIDYGLRILALSLVISVFAAVLLFLAARRLIVRPINGVIGAMTSYAEAPEDARRIIVPSAKVTELRAAETALHDMQTQLSASLKQKERLAQLGSAVAKISHDLRNILTTAQLFADRMEMSKDPGVQRAAPKLVNSISRAVNLCETTLAFGKADEPPPSLSRLRLADLVEDVFEGERLAVGDYELSFVADVPAGLWIRADSEQLHRILSNLIRNAAQAIMNSGERGQITVSATEDDAAWIVSVHDTGPGLPDKARDHLFKAFQGGARKGGFGLGLAIAADLARGHGGKLDLAYTGADGTRFNLHLPKQVAMLEDAAQ
ncbi:sensor histidine kinase [Aliiroseovarius sp. PTFE2010]|uniref:sensor histidine kinase n=1 Tax=Aliiroseovarius sp. PTFE2010 TaxID=3417190 RepID=UPI003CF24BE1